MDEGPADGGRRFLTFKVGGQNYALAAEAVAEIIPMPTLARLPHGPPALLGMANLRGTVIAVVDVATMLGRREAASAPNAAARAIVLAGATPTALVVDTVAAIVASVGAAKILDIHGMLAACLTPRQADAAAPAAAPGPRLPRAPAAPLVVLVSFGAAGQDYALHLEDVQEIIAVPAVITTMPRTDPMILGVVALRDTLLPLLSLRGLLGLPGAPDLAGAKIIVTAVSGVPVGLVADHVRDILHAEPGSVQPAPAVLAARAGGEARICGIYRNAAGDRLVSILAPANLFGSDVMKRLGDAAPAAAPPCERAAAAPLRRFLVFRLGAAEFGLPVEAIDEVTAPPDKISRLPKTPKFLEGVFNLRGDVVPIIDQRRRFDMPAYEGDPGRRRVIVLRTVSTRAGVIVDAVSEVIAAPAADLIQAPPGEPGSPVHAVLNLAEAGRMILICDPEALLSRAERGLLARLAGQPAGVA